MEKANAFGYLDRFDNVAIVDADIFIRSTAPNLFDVERGDFAGVLERDLPLTDAHRRKLPKYSEGQYGLLRDVDWHWNDLGAAFYNMGLMVLRSSLYMADPEAFIRRPEFERFVNGKGHWKWSTDQTLMNYWVKKSGMSVTNLDWRWNALYGAVNDVRDAHFVHFFLSSKLPRGGAEIPDLLRTI